MNISNFLFCKFYMFIYLAIVTVFRYIIFFRLQSELHIYRRCDNIFNTKIICYIIFEIIWAWIQPFPFMEGNYTLKLDIKVETNPHWNLYRMSYYLNIILLIPVFSRCYIIYRFFLSMSNFYDERADRITLDNFNLAKCSVVF
jgi:hypothetical protein